MISTTVALSERLDEIMAGGLDDGLLGAAATRCDTLLDRALLARDDPAVAAIARTVCDGSTGVTLPVPGQPGSFDLEAAALVTGSAIAAGSLGKAVVPAGAIAVVAAVIPTAMYHRVDGQTVLAAVAIGTEVAGRLEAGLSPTMGPGRWDPAGVCGVVAAAIASSTVLGLRAAETAAAIGIAASQTVGLGALSSTGVGSLHAGKAASNGVLAVHLAAEGFTAAIDPLGKSEGYLGYFAIFGGSRGSESLLDRFGQEWAHAGVTHPAGPDGPLRTAVTALNDAADLTRLRDAIIATRPEGEGSG